MKLKFITFILLSLFPTLNHGVEFKKTGIYRPCQYYSLSKSDGFSITYSLELGLNLLMGEPVVQSKLSWGYADIDNICFKPFGNDEAVMVDNTRGENLPFDLDLLVEVSASSHSSNKSIYLKINPGVLSGKTDALSYNTPGSPNWNKLFFTLSNGDPRDESNFNYLSVNEAKEFFSRDIYIVDTQVVKSRYNMNHARSAYHRKNRVKRKEMLTVIVSKSVNWIESNINKIPARLLKKIEYAKALPLDDSIAELVRIIDSFANKPLPGFLSIKPEDQEKYKTLQRKVKQHLLKIERKINDYNITLSSASSKSVSELKLINKAIRDKRAALDSRETSLEPDVNWINKTLQRYLVKKNSSTVRIEYKRIHFSLTGRSVVDYVLHSSSYDGLANEMDNSSYGHRYEFHLEDILYSSRSTYNCSIEVDECLKLRFSQKIINGYGGNQGYWITSNMPDRTDIIQLSLKNDTPEHTKEKLLQQFELIKMYFSN
ncbi:hypothetical protein A9Q84_13595 [Halobacteriovorax marinus]|uniref:Uncharacterized protein n=1 Tax=Halobacteriovorax marinus TaxID=97084 RepID=A0A1Y5F8Z7_9BACT|nr:hypothetical protein A9Q84_13595 [Halobacteriovorax marinus]